MASKNGEKKTKLRSDVTKDENKAQQTGKRFQRRRSLSSQSGVLCVDGQLRPQDGAGEEEPPCRRPRGQLQQQDGEAQPTHRPFTPVKRSFV